MSHRETIRKYRSERQKGMRELYRGCSYNLTRFLTFSTIAKSHMLSFTRLPLARPGFLSKEWHTARRWPRNSLRLAQTGKVESRNVRVGESGRQHTRGKESKRCSTNIVSRTYSSSIMLVDCWKCTKEEKYDCMLGMWDNGTERKSIAVWKGFSCWRQIGVWVYPRDGCRCTRT